MIEWKTEHLCLITVFSNERRPSHYHLWISDSCVQTLREATWSILEARGTVLQGGVFQLMMWMSVQWPIPLFFRASEWWDVWRG